MEACVTQITELNLADYPIGEIQRSWLHIINDGIGEAVRLPIVIARGKGDGPTLGLTAALHGNELNGIAIIQELFRRLDPDKLCGNVVGVLVSNLPGLLRRTRAYSDGVDLNRIAPGKVNGTESQVYIHRLIDRVVRHFDYMIDLHTASFGRVNSYYIRADMSDEVTARMARLQNAEIILNNAPDDSTLRGSAAQLGIKAITSEVRDPHVLQSEVISEALTGLNNVLIDLDMLKGEIVCPVQDTVLCETSRWLYTDEGGVLHIPLALTDTVEKGQELARVTNIFGDVQKTYSAPDAGVIIGKSVEPINQTGSRILHLGLEPVAIPCITAD